NLCNRALAVPSMDVTLIPVGPCGRLVKDLSVPGGGQYPPAHFGSLIRRLSAKKARRDSSQCCSDVMQCPAWYRPSDGRSPCPSHWKVHRPLCLLSLMHIRLSWVLTPTLETTSTLSCVPPPVW